MSPEGVVVTVDVEWAHPEVLADLVGLLDDHGVRATFFCTHAGIAVPGHERALHPNFRRAGNTHLPPGTDRDDDRAVYRGVVAAVSAFCPEAVGVRAHSLFHDSDLLPVYRDAGLEYDSGVMLPLAAGLEPVERGAGILELPIYWMDHWDLREGATDLTLEGLRLDRPGLKVLDVHPNLIYANAARAEDPQEHRAGYHDPDWLRARRRRGRGVRTLFVELLEALAAAGPPPVLAEVAADWRATHLAGAAR